MIQGDCRSELVLVERRGSLTLAESAALREHLRVCEQCRIARDFGSAFDRPQSVYPGDAKHLDAMLAAAERWRVAPRTLERVSTRKRAGKVVWLTAALTISATAAAAAIAVRTSTFFAPPAAESTTDVAASRATTYAGPAAPILPKALASTSTSIDIPTAPAGERVAPSGVNKPIKTAEPVARVEFSAEQLLQQANAARRASNTSEASRLFRKLQRLYPTSREARLSEVVYGTLLLEQGQAAAALEQLNRYLSVGSGQNLAAEALYGKGRALAQLGRSTEEQSVWRALLERFPKSPYASHARNRLGLSR